MNAEFEKVKEIIVDSLSCDEDAVTLEANLKEDLEADSLDAVELIMAVEEEFDIEIPDEKAAEIKTVQDISEFENSEVFKMKVEMEDVKLELEKAPVAPVNVVSAPVATPVVQAPVNQAAPVEAKEEPVVSGTPVKSPIVGVFYAASSPTAKPYVEVGSKVKAGQVLCIVEAMKVMNEIKAPIDGTVTAIMANTEDLVEYDQVLMIIEG